MNFGINFENTYSKLPEEFFERETPTSVTSPKLVAWNSDVANFFNISVNALDKKFPKELVDIFSGNKIAMGSTPITMAYSGHQFGYFSPVLGDGRAHLIGELRGSDGLLYDIHLKGSGRTKFSRSGDGRSPLGPVLREYILGEAMHFLDVPTTRNLAAIQTGELVQRENLAPGGVLTRVAQSLIRVGTFEYFASKRDTKNLKLLLDFLVERAYPEIAAAENLPLDFFKSLVHKQALLVAKWMSFGFIHGVMNTDNTSAVGITIDYGPCAFLDETDFNKVFSSIDRQGRYSYRNQPQILQWNLTRLAESLLLLYDEKGQKEMAQKFEKELNNYTNIYETQWKKLMLSKIGLSKVDNPRCIDLLTRWLTYLNSNKIDYTLGFRNLASLLTPNTKSSFFKLDDAFIEFTNEWKPMVMNAFSDTGTAIKYLNSKNPLFIPRNHIIEEIINRAYENDFSKLNDFMMVIKKPFKAQEQFGKFAEPPKENEKVWQTFCGT